MSFSAIQNIPIVVDLLSQAKTTGWTIITPIAYHDSCNPGNIILTSYPVKAGVSYQVSWMLLTNSGGYVQVQSPGSNGAEQTTPGLFVETIKPNADGFVSFYSNSTSSIQSFNIQPISIADGVTIVYSAINKKWSDFRTFYPDYGWSLYTRTITGYQGNLYNQNNGDLSNPNYFYGEQFVSSIKVAEAKNPAIIKEFAAINYQANSLLVTTIDGIQTSLGQISTLIDTDFIKQKLSSGGVEILNYNVDGVYSASFLGDENDNIVDGPPLRGNWIIIELVQNDGSVPLVLFSIAVRSRYAPIGSR